MILADDTQHKRTILKGKAREIEGQVAEKIKQKQRVPTKTQLAASLGEQQW